jgi:putative endonuclease
MPFTYLFQCRDGSLCVGTTVDLDHHLRLVDAGAGPSPTRPEHRRPLRRVWSEEHPSLAAARRRAQQLRGLGRARLREVVEGRVRLPAPEPDPGASPGASPGPSPVDGGEAVAS